jgi:hypothetical protein
MGRNSRRRHVDKQRRAAERRRRRQSEDAAGPSGSQHEPPSNVPPSNAPPSNAPRDDAPSDVVSRACEQLESVLGLVLRDGLWARGWQPDDVLRQIRRSSSGPAQVDLLTSAIAADAAHHDRVGNEVHASWRCQTDRIVARAAYDPAHDGWVARWLATAGDGAGLSAAHMLLDQLLMLPSLPLLVPPPGSSHATFADLADLAGTGTEPSPTLARIRALLAKAESTSFPAEAEAFTAKAQAMMMAARVDDAALRASSGRRSTGRVSAGRISLDEPYVASKRSLLAAVCAANDVRCVFHPGVDLATVVGPVGQLAHVELLFTSLLIQVQAALGADAASAPPGSHVRSRRYRSSFILGFALRVGRRLHDARSAGLATAGADALPVLADDDAATADLFERLIGSTTRLRSSPRLDAAGARAGTAAADRASLRESGIDGPMSPPATELPDAS